MKIVLINHIYIDSELSSTTQLSIVKSLNNIGYKADLYVPSLVPKSGIKNVHSIKMPSKNSFTSSPLFNLKLLFAIRKIINSEQPDAIIVDHLSFFGALPYIVVSNLHLLNIQFIFDVRSQPVSLTGLVGKFRNTQYRFAMKFSNLIMKNYTFLTTLMAKEQCLINGIDMAKKNIGIWGCGVDVDYFNPDLYKENAVELRKKLGLQKKFVIFYHGAISFNRGLDNVVRAMTEVKKFNHDIVLVLLGEGSEKKGLEILVNNKSLNGSVVILPPVKHSEVAQYIAMANVGIIPLPDHSDWRAQQPIKLSEFMAMQKPILVTNIPAHTDIVKNISEDLILRDNHPKTIAQAIKKAYLDRSKLGKLGKEGRTLVTNNLTWDKIAERLAIYLISLNESSRM